jgi:hypothetical protein
LASLSDNQLHYARLSIVPNVVGYNKPFNVASMVEDRPRLSILGIRRVEARELSLLNGHEQVPDLKGLDVLAMQGQLLLHLEAVGMDLHHAAIVQPQ